MSFEASMSCGGEDREDTESLHTTDRSDRHELMHYHNEHTEHSKHNELNEHRPCSELYQGRRSPSGSESLDVIFGEREAQRGAERCAQAAEIAPDGWEWWARRGSDAISKGGSGGTKLSRSRW